MAKKRASYRTAVAWIAENDESGTGHNMREVSEYTTTCLVADLFGVEPMEVAEVIIRYRDKNGLATGTDF